MPLTIAMKQQLADCWEHEECQQGGDDKAGDDNDGLAVAALVVGGLALIIGIAALVTSRRSPT